VTVSIPHPKVLVAAIAVVTFVIAGLLATVANPPPRLIIPEEAFALPALTTAPTGCLDVALENAVLAGAHDINHGSVWLQQGVQHIDVVFPPGYEAVFTLEPFEILDPSGRTVARGGDAIRGGCTTGPNATGPLLILFRRGAANAHVTFTNAQREQ
jgi:hypothetical protein